MKKVGRYHVVAELKRNIQTTTCRGYDPHEEKFVLLKVSNFPAVEQDRDELDRMRTEAEMYRQLRHPNIARFNEAGVEKVYPYLAIEFIDGADLRTLVNAADRFPLDIAIFFIYDLLSGLDYLHRQKIVHRDLKPENIMIDAGGLVKICDFDLALDLSETQEIEAEISGSVGYLAPETILGDKSSFSSDLFSLGVIAYEILSGSRPFQSDSISNETQATIHRAAIPLTQLNPSVPTRLAGFVELLLTKEAAGRPQTAGEALSVLKNMCNLPPESEYRSAMTTFVSAPKEYASAFTKQLVETLTDMPAFDFKARKTPAWLALSIFAVLFTLALLAVREFFISPDPNPEKITVIDGPPQLRSNSSTNDAQPSEKTPNQNIAQPPSQDNEAQNREESNSEPKNPIEETEDPAVVRSVEQPNPPPVEKKAFLGKEVFFATRPWSFISIDGDSAGVLENSGTFFLERGTRKVTFQNPQMPIVDFNVEVGEESPDTLQYNLFNYIGELALIISPYAENVKINGESIEGYSNRKPIWLRPGEHDLEIVNTAARSENFSTIISLRAGQKRTFLINLFVPTIQEQH